MRVMVTGGAGFVGSHLCDKLLSMGSEVWCVDNLQTGSLINIKEASLSKNFHFIQADVRDFIPEINIDRLYNLACPAAPVHYQRDPIGTLKTNVIGTLNALSYCRLIRARLLQASTSEVYGDPEIHPQTESYAGSVNCTGIRACYDEGKRAAETLCFDFNREYDTEIRVARIFNTYGPRMSRDDGRVVSNFVTQALDGAPLTIYGDGEQTRSFCYVEDMVDALIRLMEMPGSCIGPINLGNPAEFTVLELASLVLEKTGSSSPLTRLPLPQDDPKLRRPDISRAKAVLGWEPTVALSQGLDRMMASYQGALPEPGVVVPLRTGVTKETVAIIGAGPAGLTAAYELLQSSDRYHVVVLEASDAVGGIARTESYKGYRFDIGGHRFFSKVPAVRDLWNKVLGEEFLTRPRMSRIYYKGKYYSYPLKVFNALGNIGVYESGRIILSYIKWRLRPHIEETNFEQWVTNRFGGRLFWHFFKTYTEKVWGMPCNEIQADWAAQRIKNMSLSKTLINALTGINDTVSMIETFQYPRLGPGMMWEAFAKKVRDDGGEILMERKVVSILHTDANVTAIEMRAPDGTVQTLRVDHVISSMPITELVTAFHPKPPTEIVNAAKRLRYRDFLIVVLILRVPDPFPDNWIYIHSPEVKVGRIQNFRSWSPDMVPNSSTSSIGMEYFCQENDELWTGADSELIARASMELETLKLGSAADVIDATVIRQPKAYPVYDSSYREALDLIRGCLAGYDNLQVVGRNGMHRYNNQDHSMMTALLAAQNIMGGEHDLWSVNVDKEYHENIEGAPDLSKQNAA